MIKSETPADLLHGFLKAVQDSLIAPLRANQTKIAYQPELRESKRFQESELKLREFSDAYSFVRDNNFSRDNVVSVIRKLNAEREASRMTQFIEKTQLSLQESDAFKEALNPYLSLLKFVDEIRRLQTTLMNQGKIKKMPLPYNELTASFTETAALAAKMPEILINGICSHSENLDQVA